MKEFAKHCEFEMPGKSYDLELTPLSESEALCSRNVKKHIIKLAEDIGDRNYKRPQKLEDAATYIASEFSNANLLCERQVFHANNQEFCNLETSISGMDQAEEILVIGAHYDSADCPGANDNGSGVATVLELARLLSKSKNSRTIRLVSFANEEHFFGSEGMGSYYYAKQCREKKENIVGMVSVETIGYYSKDNGSQKFPSGIEEYYPDKGDFIAFVSNTESAPLLKKTIEHFREVGKFPSEGFAAPSWFEGVSRSDHSQFWSQGYPAIMMTDTANYRYPYYHTVDDTPDKVDFDNIARVISGLSKTVSKLASPN